VIHSNFYTDSIIANYSNAPILTPRSASIQACSTSAGGTSKSSMHMHNGVLGKIPALLCLNLRQLLFECADDVFEIET